MGCDDWKWDREPVVKPKGHTLKREIRKDYRPGYGDTSEEYNQPWIVCSCGFEQKTDGYSGDFSRSYRFLKVEHAVNVLAAEADIEIEEVK